MDSAFNIPTRNRGRQSAEQRNEYAAQLKTFCAFIRETADTIDFRPSSRGWAYMLENERLIDKSQIDAAQGRINEARKLGLLPLDICAEDAKRQWHNVEQTDELNPDDEAKRIIRTVEGFIDNYYPVSFWDDKPCFIQMVVEKIDLRELFLPVCKRWRIPIANGGGWSDLNVRGEMMRRFAEHEAEGRTPILLYCGDFDPVGIKISDSLLENMRDLSGAVGGWEPDRVIVDRFGLNYDFIIANQLTWIDNLQTSGKGACNDLADPKHPHHNREYVQDYLRQYGAWKVEANALVTRAQAGRQLCADALLKYIPDPDAPEKYEAQQMPMRAELRAALNGLAE